MEDWYNMEMLQKIKLKKALFVSGFNQTDNKLYERLGFNTLGSELIKKLNEVKK